MEVKMIECPRGHYYNAAQYKTCPECAKQNGGFPKTEPVGAAGAAPIGGGFPKTEPVGGPSPIGGQSAFPKTEPIGYGGNNNMNNNTGIGVTMPVDNHNMSNAGYQQFGSVTQPAVDYSSPNPGAIDQPAVQPVVGWLVCIDGVVKGIDYRIHDGYNYIGRETGDIHIGGDNTISREKHAVVSYYAKRQTFYIGPAEGRNIIELNDEPVLAPVQIKDYDVITIGTTKLMLITMCGPRFNWTEGLKNE